MYGQLYTTERDLAKHFLYNKKGLFEELIKYYDSITLYKLFTETTNAKEKICSEMIDIIEDEIKNDPFMREEYGIKFLTNKEAEEYLFKRNLN